MRKICTLSKLLFILIFMITTTALAVPTHITVYAYAPHNGNTGIDKTTFVVK